MLWTVLWHKNNFLVGCREFSTPQPRPFCVAPNRITNLNNFTISLDPCMLFYPSTRCLLCMFGREIDLTTFLQSPIKMKNMWNYQKIKIFNKISLKILALLSCCIIWGLRVAWNHIRALALAPRLISLHWAYDLFIIWEPIALFLDIFVWFQGKTIH